MHVVHRNYLVWRKLLGSALVGHLADPLIWLVGLGFGLGSLLPSVGGLTYMEFLGSGMLCYSVMNSASFEGLWSAFTRLKVQRTWESILHAPMTVADIVIGEWVWAALKGTLSGTAILLVMTALGLVKSAAALWVLPVVAARRAGIRRTGADRDGAREGLRHVHVLLQPAPHADDARVGRILSVRATARGGPVPGSCCRSSMPRR